jgi:hypothetical protein
MNFADCLRQLLFHVVPSILLGIPSEQQWKNIVSASTNTLQSLCCEPRLWWLLFIAFDI